LIMDRRPAMSCAAPGIVDRLSGYACMSTPHVLEEHL
jgi:hypothetical protein